MNESAHKHLFRISIDYTDDERTTRTTCLIHRMQVYGAELTPRNVLRIHFDRLMGDLLDALDEEDDENGRSQSGR